MSRETGRARRLMGAAARWVMSAALIVTSAMGMTACVATRDYVDERDRELRAVLSARLDALERESKAVRADLTAVTARLVTAEQKLEEAQAAAARAQSTADAAQNSADGAQTRADAAQNRADLARSAAEQGGARAAEAQQALERATANRFRREPVTEVTVLFPVEKASLSRQAQVTLERVMATLRQNPTYTLDIIGYTDADGERDNATLSAQRVDIVRRRLTHLGVDMNRVYFIGLGEEGFTARRGTKNDRQVVLRILKPAD